MLQMLPILLNELIIVPAAFLCLLPMKNQLRWSAKRTALIVVAALAVLVLGPVWLHLRFSISANLLFFTQIALCFIGYCLILKADFSRCLAVFLLVFSNLSLLSCFAVVYDAWRNPELDFTVITMDYEKAQFLLVFLAILVYSWPLSRYGSYLVDSLALPAVWYATVPLSLIMLILCFFIQPYENATFFTGNYLRDYCLLYSMLYTAQITLLILFYFIVSGILGFEEVSARNRLLEMQESQFIAQQRYMKESERVRHDFRQSLHTLRRLYDAGDMEALGKYLREYEESQPQNEITPFCRSNAVNALLNHYLHKAQAAGIDIVITTELPVDPPFRDTDLCGIIGNILENAVTACASAAEKFIRLTITEKNGTVLYIVATNSYGGKLRLQGNRYLSTKHSGEGIGLSSVRIAAERLGGIADFSHDTEAFYSSIAIPMQAPEEKEAQS